MRQLPLPPSLTLAQKAEAARRFTQYAAFSVLVLSRRRLGYRVLNLLVLFIVFAVLMLLSGFGDPVHRPQDVRCFAIAMLVAGLVQRISRWRNLVETHTYYIGDSWLQSLHWPAWMQRDRFIPRFVEPTLVFLIGLALFKLGYALLGLWLMFSSLGLRWLEFHLYQKELHRRLDTTDGLYESNEQGDYVEQFSTPPDQNQNQSDEPGIAVGIGDDIREHINHNKNK